MRSIRNLMFTTDLSELSLNALSHAVEFAIIQGSKLHLVYVAASSASRDAAKAMESLVERARALAGEAPLSIETHVASGEVVALAIRALAMKLEIDLILMATSGRRGLSHFFLGSVASEVLRGAPCSVYIAKGSKSGRPSYRKILVPVDFSPFSLNQAEYAADFARKSGCELHLFHVVEPQALPDFYTYGSKDLNNYTDVKENLYDQLKSLAVQAGILDFSSHVGMGIPSAEIVNLAKKLEVGLVIAATNGHKGRNYLPLGGSTEAMARLLECPLWAIRM